MRTALISSLALLLAGSALAQRAGPSLDEQLKSARAEQAAADNEAQRLERIAAKAQSEADRIRAQQAAAAQAIESAEARIVRRCRDAISIGLCRRAPSRARRGTAAGFVASRRACRNGPSPAASRARRRREHGRVVKVRILLDSEFLRATALGPGAFPRNCGARPPSAARADRGARRNGAQPA